jgi:hypothetical protein
MSAPDTDLERQRKRHRGPIVGMMLGLVFVAFVAIVAVVWPGIPLEQQAAPDGAPTEITDDGGAASGGPSTDTDTAGDDTQ